ncbi:MAG: flagellar export protein FliJ [bacterium]
MAKFNFKLQRVLDIRAHREEEAKMAFAYAQGVYIQERTALDKMIANRQRYLEELKQKESSQGVSVPEVRYYYNYLGGLAKGIENQEKRVKEALFELERARQKLVKATQDKRAMEKLKDRHYKTFKEDEEKAEQSTIDEVGLGVFLNKKRPS